MFQQGRCGCEEGEWRGCRRDERANAAGDDHAEVCRENGDDHAGACVRMFRRCCRQDAVAMMANGIAAGKMGEAMSGEWRCSRQDGGVMRANDDAAGKMGVR